MACDARDDADIDESSGEDTDNDEDGEREGNEDIDNEMDREREGSDRSMVDECEKFAEQREFDASDLSLEPISVTERREVCVLLSKVRNISLLQGPH